MRKRFSLITLALALSLSLSAQQMNGIAAMNEAIGHFLHSSELMTLDTHWSRKQQQWNFKHVTSANGSAMPSALHNLLDAFSQNVAYAASSYFHDTRDGGTPFATLVYQRADDFYSGIVGTYDMKDNYNFRILNFRDAEGLTSFGITWCETDFTDRSGQAFRTIDGRVFKFYGGIWQMKPFRQDNPWMAMGKMERRPISKSERALYETLLSQMQYLNGLYQQNQQSGNEQNCDAIAYTMKNLMDGYEGKLTQRQYAEIVKATSVFDKSAANSERSRMIGKGKAKLSKSVISSPVSIENMNRNEGLFVKNDDLRLLPLKYKLGVHKVPNTVEVSLAGPVSDNDWPIKIAPLYPKYEAYEAEVEHHQFTLTADFARNQLLEISDKQGRRMLVFADSIPTTIDLTQMTLKGSTLNERFAECQRRLHALEPERHKYVSEFGFNHDFEVMDAEGFNQLSDDAHQLQMQFIEENADNLIPVWYLAENYATMTLNELSRYLKKDRPYADHVALQPVWQWYEGLKLRQPGQMFHDAACVDTAGVAHRLSDYIGRGDYVVLNFWSTWEILTRSNCKTMKQIARDYADKNLRVIGFALDLNKQDWCQYVKARNLEYEHLSAPENSGNKHDPWSADIVKAYGINALPETIIFDPKGRIVSIGLSGNTLKDQVRSLPLKKK